MTDLQFLFATGIPSSLIIASGIHQNLRLHRMICALDAFHKRMDLNDRKYREQRREREIQLEIFRSGAATVISRGMLTAKEVE